MALILNVPYAEKDEAKALGARWNSELKTWYATNRREYAKFKKWLDGHTVVCDQIYIVQGRRKCYHCGNLIEVVAFGFDTFFPLGRYSSKMDDNSVHLGTTYSKLPEPLDVMLNERFNFRKNYSKGDCYGEYKNYCQICNFRQGNYHLLEEVDSPFFISTREDAERLTLYKIQLPYDICISASIGYGSYDHLIKEFANFVDLDIEWNTVLPPSFPSFDEVVEEHPFLGKSTQQSDEYDKLLDEFTRAAKSAIRYENSNGDSVSQQQSINSSSSIRYTRPKTHAETPSWRCTLLLAIFLGFLGIHRMYVGKVGTGILYLFTFGLGGIGWLADIVAILDCCFYDSNGHRIRRK